MARLRIADKFLKIRTGFLSIRGTADITEGLVAALENGEVWHLDYSNVNNPWTLIGSITADTDPFGYAFHHGGMGTVGGHLYLVDPTTGNLHRSVNGGVSYVEIGLDILCLDWCYDAANDFIYFLGNNSGIYKIENASDPTPDTPVLVEAFSLNVGALAIDPNDTSRVFAIHDDTVSGGLACTVLGGGTTNIIGLDGELFGNAVQATVSGDGTIFASYHKSVGGFANVYFSSADGVTWASVASQAASGAGTEEDITTRGLHPHVDGDKAIGLRWTGSAGLVDVMDVSGNTPFTPPNTGRLMGSAFDPAGYLYLLYEDGSTYFWEPGVTLPAGASTLEPLAAVGPNDTDCLAWYRLA